MDGVAAAQGIKDNKILPQYLTPDSNCSDRGFKRGQSIRLYQTTSRPHAAPEMTVYIEELQDTTWQMMPALTPLED